MSFSIDEIKKALLTKSGFAGAVAMLIPVLNPWLVSHGYTSFLDANGKVSGLSFVLAGVWAIANRAAIAKSKASNPA